VTFVVVVADRIDQDGVDLFGTGGEFEVVSTADHPERLPEELPRAAALVVRSSTQVTADIIATARNLKVIARAGMGVDNIDVAAATRAGIAVLNTPGANTISAAEHTLALLLALLRNVPRAMSSLERGEWDRKRFGGTELYGKTLSALGLGRIGRHVVRLAQAFGVRVLAHDPYLSSALASELQVTLVSLEDALRHADVVTLHMPLTDDTRHIMNAAGFALMKPTAVLVNTARGGLIDHAALVAALDAGQLAGAALDVFEAEPLDPRSPLRTSEKVVLTPHLAASTAEAQKRVALEVCESVKRALAEGDVSGAINRGELVGASRS
jgi:D-3-phosphoglycerate dehydrogenase